MEITFEFVYTDKVLDALILEKESRNVTDTETNEANEELWRKIGKMTNDERGTYFFLMDNYSESGVGGLRRI